MNIAHAMRIAVDATSATIMIWTKLSTKSVFASSASIEPVNAITIELFNLCNFIVSVFTKIIQIN